MSFQTAIVYCTVAISVCTILLIVATALNVQNYRTLRKIQSRALDVPARTAQRTPPAAAVVRDESIVTPSAAPPAPASRERNVPSPARRTTGASYYDDIGETEFTGKVEPYTPADRQAP